MSPPSDSVLEHDARIAAKALAKCRMLLWVTGIAFLFIGGMRVGEVVRSNRVVAELSELRDLSSGMEAMFSDAFLHLAANTLSESGEENFRFPEEKLVPWLNRVEGLKASGHVDSKYLGKRLHGFHQRLKALENESAGDRQVYMRDLTALHEDFASLNLLAENGLLALDHSIRRESDWVSILGVLVVVILLWINFRALVYQQKLKVESDRNFKTLSATAQEFEIIFDFALAGMVQFTASDHRFIRVNHRFCEMLGYREDELLKLTVDDVVHPDDACKWPDNEGPCDGSTETTQEKRLVHKQGHSLWVRCTTSWLRNEKGTTIRGSAIIVDLSPLREMQNRLTDEKLRLRTLIDNIPDLVFFKDTDLIYRGCNKAFEHFVGLTEQELVGKTDFDLVDEENAEIYRSKDRQILQTGETVRIESRLHHPKKGWCYYETIKSAVFDQQGQATDIVGISRDVTELRLEAQSLQDEKRLFMLGPVVVFRWLNEPGMPVAYVSENVTDVMGYSRDQLVAEGFSYLELIHPEDRGRHVEVITQACAQGDSALSHQSYRLLKSDGSYIWVQDYTSIVRDDTGAAVRLRGYVLDITAQVIAEQKLKESQMRWQFALEATGDSAWDWNLREGCVTSTKEWRMLVGGFSENLKEPFSTWISWIHPNDREAFQEALSRHSQSDEPLFISEHRLVCQSGAVRWVMVRGRSLEKDDSGNVIRIIGTTTDITSRKWNEKLLLESEQRVRALFDEAADPIFLHDYEGRIWDCNRAACQVLGYTRNEMLKLTVFDIDRSYLPQTAGPIWSELKGGKTMTIEGCHYRKDGSHLSVEVRIACVRQSDEWMVLAIARDITQRRLMESELRQNRSDLQRLMDNFPFMVWLKDRDCRFVVANKMVAQNAGWKNPQDIVGKTDFDLSPAYLAEKYHEGDVEVMRSGKKTNVEELVLVEGKERWFETYKAPLFDDQGEITGTVGFSREITLRKRAESDLRESELKFRQFAENIEEVFWMYDCEQARMIYISPAYERVWGKNTRAVLSDSDQWLEYVLPEDRPLIGADYRQSQMRGEYDVVYRIRRQDGSIRWIHDRSYALTNDQGVVYRLIGIAEDITERKQLEEQIRQTQKMEAIGTLAGGIAHDFNNILTAINGYAELAQLMTRDTQVQQHIDAILKAGWRAADLVKQILTFSRQQHSRHESLDLSEIVEDSVRLLRASIPKLIEFHIRCAPNLPRVLADPTQLQQVIMNLGTNAWHAIPEGQPGKIEIMLEAVRRGDPDTEVLDALPEGPFIRLVVTDNGKGMPPDIIGRIFEPFFTTKDPGQGTGLGLAVVHGIVQSHGGCVEVKSQVNEGTTFKIYIPAVASEDMPDLLKTIKVGLRAGENQRIMVVDDEMEVMHLTGEVLKKLGYRVELFNDPRAALEFFDNHKERIDLVLTDQTMPHMTGYDLAQEILKIIPTQPIILMTGYGARLSSETLFESGIKELLPKPFTANVLGDVVHRVLNPSN